MEQIIPVDLGFSVADGEDIEVHFSGGDLVLRFVNWQGQPIEHHFVETLAFRWSAMPSHPTPRDDSTYEVLLSAWLDNEIRVEGFPMTGDFAHHILYFNAGKVLEVISRRAIGVKAG